MNNFSLRNRLQYRLDIMMSRGTPALILGLALATVFVVLLVSGILLLFRLQPHSGATPQETLWTTFMHVYDPSQIAYDEGSWVYKLIIFSACLGGIFILSTLIGVLTTGFDSRLGELRKGRSPVLEKNHIIILGWSEQIFAVIRELLVANENQHKACIVILAEKGKVEMEDEIRAKLPQKSRTKIVCRTGNPMNIIDQDIVEPASAKSIIIMPPDDSDPDAYTIKVLLALVNNPERGRQSLSIVAEMQERKNYEVAKIIAKDEVTLITGNEVISRIIAQTCRQPGLSLIYTELLDFDGDEIYFHKEAQLHGKSFGEALSRFEDSSLIGLRKKDGRVLLKPPMSAQIDEDDKIIAISKDDDTIRFSAQIPAPDEGIIVNRNSLPAGPERTLVLGWNSRANHILGELDRYIRPGSDILAIAASSEAREAAGKLCGRLQNAHFEFREGDTTSRELLDAIGCADYHNIIVLSNSGESMQDADTATLITLVHLRDIAEKTGANFSIVSEMLDERNRELAKITSTNDFIVSSKIMALLLTQLSENRELLPVLGDLFDADGAEIYLKPAADYVRLNTETDFYTVLEAARRREEIAIGYKKAGSNAPSSVYLNPKKSERFSFTEGDQLIVIADE